MEQEIPTKQVVIEETTVRVMKQSAQPFARNIILKGSAEADKNVQLCPLLAKKHNELDSDPPKLVLNSFDPLAVL